MPKYTLVKTINADGKSPLFYFEGPSDATEPTDDWITDNSELLQKDTGVRKFKKGNTWEPIASSDGSGGSSGEGGSGGGQFVVTFGDFDFEHYTVGSADKTYAQVLEAVASGQNVVASFAGTGFLIPVSQAINGLPIAFSNATHTDSDLLVKVTLASDESTSLHISSLASEWFATSEATSVHNQLAPMIVNLTMDTSGENPAYVGDKTYREIFDAYMAHKDVQIIIPTVGAFNVISCMKTEDAGNDLYLILYPDMGRQTIAMVSGGASDYFSIDS